MCGTFPTPPSPRGSNSRKTSLGQSIGLLRHRCQSIDDSSRSHRTKVPKGAVLLQIFSTTTGSTPAGVAETAVDSRPARGLKAHSQPSGRVPGSGTMRRVRPLEGGLGAALAYGGSARESRQQSGGPDPASRHAPGGLYAPAVKPPHNGGVTACPAPTPLALAAGGCSAGVPHGLPSPICSGTMGTAASQHGPQQAVAYPSHRRRCRRRVVKRTGTPGYRGG